MRRSFTLLSFVLTLLFCLVSSVKVSAQSFPKVNELTGRYTFTGSATGTDGLNLPSITGHDMVVVPAEQENQVLILGYFGYGGGATFNYDEATGKLTIAQTTIVIYSDGFRLMFVVDNGGNPIDVTYQVQKSGDVISISSTTDLLAEYKDFENGKMQDVTYTSGYSMIKQTLNVPLKSFTNGVYSFVGQELLTYVYPESFEEFDLKIYTTDVASYPANVMTSGWFDHAGLQVEGKYYEDGGILLLPASVKMNDELYFGVCNDVTTNNPDYNMNPQPFFLVNKDELTSPSYFRIVKPSDMYPYNDFSVRGATATFKQAASVEQLAGHGGLKVQQVDGGVLIQSAGEALIKVVDVEGRTVAQKQGSALNVNNVKPGIYVVRAGSDVVKINIQ